MEVRKQAALPERSHAMDVVQNVLCLASRAQRGQAQNAGAATRGGQRSNFRPKRSNFSPVPRHTKAKLEGPTCSKKARRASRAAPFL